MPGEADRSDIPALLGEIERAARALKRTMAGRATADRPVPPETADDVRHALHWLREAVRRTGAATGSAAGSRLEESLAEIEVEEATIEIVPRSSQTRTKPRQPGATRTDGPTAGRDGPN